MGLGSGRPTQENSQNQLASDRVILPWQESLNPVLNDLLLSIPFWALSLSIYIYIGRSPVQAVSLPPGRQEEAHGVR